jgi:hypothetical protein
MYRGSIEMYRGIYEISWLLFVLEYYSFLMDRILPETIPKKIFSFHIPIGLFFDEKLDYFSVLYYGIGEISGIFKSSGRISGEEYIRNPDRKYF